MSLRDRVDAFSPDLVERRLGPLVTEERKARIEEVLAGRLAGISVVLENLHDPHNGAAVIRSMEGFGVGDLHVVESKEPFRFSQAVTQGCEKWVTVTRHAQFAAAAARLRAQGFKLWAALPGAEVTLAEIEVGEGQKAALVFGNEHDGLSDEAIAACDARFSIPMAGFTQSFNLSVSAAVCLHDTTWRRRKSLGRPGDLDDQERARLRAWWYALSMDPRAAEGLLDRDPGD